MSKKYTISLDIGTTSVGWAVLDEFELAKKNKKIKEIEVDGSIKIKKKRTNLWGVRLFDEASTAEGTRLKRGARRRIARRTKRLKYLREIFEPYVKEFDPNFFIRLVESFLQNNDNFKKVKVDYPLFNGETGEGETYLDEKDYYKKYPTIYHLRSRLIENKDKADLRLIYLALHHILKYRGHFVNEGQSFNMENINVIQSLEDLDSVRNLAIHDFERMNEVLTNRKFSKSKKVFELKPEDNKEKFLYNAIVGLGIDLFKIFDNEEYKPSDTSEIPKASEFKYSLEAEKFEEKMAIIESVLQPEEIEVIQLGKNVYESIVLCNILTEKTLSLSMVKKFETHKNQLKELKDYAHEIGRYDELFKKDGIYTKYVENAKSMPRDEFYKQLEKLLGVSGQGEKKKSETHNDFYEKIKEDLEFENYLPKQRYRDNGSIPYQIHEHELKEILKNQSVYYPFLGEIINIKTETEEGIKTTEEYKIQTLMKFRIPYYVGPLTQALNGEIGHKKSDKSRFAWMQKNKGKEDTKITPWNFSEVVDKEASAVEFIERMTAFCTYLPEEKVLPDNSLIYQEFKIYNELIIGGWYGSKGEKIFFDSSLRKQIVDKLFKNYKKVSAKQMVAFLHEEKYTPDEISVKRLFGIDTVVSSPKYNTSYSTYIDLKNAGIEESLIEERKDIFEQIIKWATIFEDKKILKKTITDANENAWNNLLTEDQVKSLSKLRYKGWGRLSKKLLTGIKASNGKSILDNLKEEEYKNFMRLLEDEQIKEAIKEAELNEKDVSKLDYSLVSDLAGSPALKKGIWQSLKIIKELESFLGRENIDKIVVEMARGTEGGRTTTRKKQIEKFYDKSSKVSQSLKEEFENAEEKSFDNERIFLYFLQNAKCMYSGEALSISELSSYEVDHIIPQSYTTDNSFDNKVLVKRAANQNKGGDVPSKEVINRMSLFWDKLSGNGQVSKKKLSNLNRGTLTDEAKEGFINRQLVETRQISKHVANILSEYFSNTKTEILTPKAGLTSQFRRGFVYVTADEFKENAEKYYEMAKKYNKTEEDLQFNSKFYRVYFHPGFIKNRDINDHHHAHDAYLNAVVANYVYKTRPDLKNMWVYGEYQKKSEKEMGKYAAQRDKFFKQLLTGMKEDVWKLVDIETGEITELYADEVIKGIEKTLDFRNVNVVKMSENQKGAFSKEGNLKAGQGSLRRKNNLPIERYGGSNAESTNIAVLGFNKKGEISIESFFLSDKNQIKDKKLIIKKFQIYKTVSGYSRYLTAPGEAQKATQYKGEADNFYSLIEFALKNGLINSNKINEEVYKKYDSLEHENKEKVLKNLMKLCARGTSRGLTSLKLIGLPTDIRYVTSKDLISIGTTIIYQSSTGLYETHKKL